MSFKEDIIRKLTVPKLKLLAAQHRIPLIKNNPDSFAHETIPITKKQEIIKVLLKSGKITEKAITELSKPKEKNIPMKGIPKAVKNRVWAMYICADNARARELVQVFDCKYEVLFIPSET